MGRTIIPIVACVLLCLPNVSWAQETLYVTDKLLLGLYAKPDTSSDSLATLVSGTPLQLLERGKYFTRVRTSDGVEGWVKSAYLVDDKPPRLMLDEAQAANASLTKQLQQTREELQSEKSAATQAKAQLQQTQSDRAERSARLAQLESRNHQLQQRLAAGEESVPWYWLIATGVLCLLLGIWLGRAWIDYRIRRRHGGFRIY